VANTDSMMPIGKRIQATVISMPRTNTSGSSRRAPGAWLSTWKPPRLAWPSRPKTRTEVISPFAASVSRASRSTRCVRVTMPK
jgi:hypothetical protein